ncbi:4'-phosphopantetheinyl transferase superfamily protein [Streptomyces sp. NPDC005566]|uniref:4'-phosphopantetheinyl transferase family protein n=1 Tax=Streptomyces sp. NPDC005566 TaxID=3156886 RepID=UPI00339F29A5
MIEQILPPTVIVSESFGDPAGMSLLPEEEPLVAAAVEKRRREFTAVRHCARQALGALGMPPVPILSGPRGAPVWPAGVVGSMTHCEGYCASVLARSSEFAALGVDAEPHGPLPEGVLEAIGLPGERARTRQLSAEAPSVCWDRLLFSAKEAVYKAWFPLTGRPLDFEEADIVFDRRAGTFRARVLAPRPPVAVLTGRFLVDPRLVCTGVALPAARGTAG